MFHFFSALAMWLFMSLRRMEPDIAPLYYDLIKRWNEVSSVPVILNISLNVCDEPIMTPPENTHSTSAKTSIDALVISRHVMV